MSYRSTAEIVTDLSRTQQLLVFEEPIEAKLEVAAVLRQVYRAQGPAVLFTKVQGCQFPIVGNLYGRSQRARYLLRHGLKRVERAMRLKGDPSLLLREPLQALPMLASLPHLIPRWSRKPPVLRHRIHLSQLPQLVSWPQDGGPFITLPICYSQHPQHPGWLKSNLGMYRIQLAGNDYLKDSEVGLHYQIHRGIGVHHQAAQALQQRLWVNIFVGGPPALTWAAVMPLPEALPELAFAGALAGAPIALAHQPHSPLPVAAEADFAIIGWVEPGLNKPEGPFGDHLGYYSLQHDFPVLKVAACYHRPGAIWPTTTVGRPPQEDTTFGELIHHWTDPVLPTVLPGVKQIHAVDAAGVHPLLLAIGSERYTPYQKVQRPQELLTQANAILGQGQLSLAKYLLMVAEQDAPQLDCKDILAFFQHWLSRIDWRRDLHFHTQSTMDTLDYSGSALNQGSKLVATAAGPPLRTLPQELPESRRLPSHFEATQIHLPGVLGIRGPSYRFDAQRGLDPQFLDLQRLPLDHPLAHFPLWVVGDPSRHLQDFLWMTFTRSNPAADLYGVAPTTYQRHWGCQGPLIIDARPKPHHAPELEEDPEVLNKLQAWSVRGGPLQDWG